MFINSLKYPYRFKVSPNEEEDIDRLLFDEVESNIECSIERAYNADLKGDNLCSIKEYKSVIYYYFIIEYIKIIKRYAERIGITNTECLPSTIKEEFKVDCVSNKLLCIGKNLNQNYNKFLLNGFKLAGIGFDNVECSNCCEGIGIMTIDGSNDCTAFIINTCEQLNDVPVISTGEFTTNEFINIERT